MTLSLTVILIETTGNISFALPLIVTLICAKWMGDYFNDGIYDTNIEVAKVPMLPWHAKKSSEGLQIRQIMNNPPVCIRVRERTSRIIHILKTYSYNGFPVVDDVEPGSQGDPSTGRLRGFILRSQLIVILKNSFYDEKQEEWIDDISIDDFRDEYPRYPSIDVSFTFIQSTPTNNFIFRPPPFHRKSILKKRNATTQSTPKCL